MAQKKRQTVLETLKERNKTHGNFADCSATAQELKQWMRDVGSWRYLAYDQREALELSATKISRLLHGDPNHIDGWHDIAGFAMLIEQRLIKEEA